MYIRSSPHERWNIRQAMQIKEASSEKVPDPDFSTFDQHGFLRSGLSKLVRPTQPYLSPDEVWPLQHDFHWSRLQAELWQNWPYLEYCIDFEYLENHIYGFKPTKPDWHLWHVIFILHLPLSCSELHWSCCSDLDRLSENLKTGRSANQLRALYRKELFAVKLSVLACW